MLERYDFKNEKVSINLCDFFVVVSEPLDTFLESLPVGGIDRLYIGSYYCSNYYLQLPYGRYQEMMECARSRGYKVTLVIPPLLEKDLEKAEARLKSLLKDGDDLIDEISINDLGMIEIVKDFQGRKMNLGRVLQKDNRDPRYESYFNQTHTHRIFTDFYRAFLTENKISGIELDCTHESICIPKGYEEFDIAVHVPYCYMSLGSICLFASMEKERDSRYRFADKCKMGCMKVCVECTSQDGFTFYRAGRSVQFKNDSCRIDCNGYKVRFIYTPIDEIYLRSNQNEDTGTFK